MTTAPRRRAKIVGMELGGRFWLGLLGICVGAVVVGAIIFLLFGWAWSAFGFLGAFLVFGAVVIGFAYIHDRREQTRRSRLTA